MKPWEIRGGVGGHFPYFLIVPSPHHINAEVCFSLSFGCSAKEEITIYTAFLLSPHQGQYILFISFLSFYIFLFCRDIICFPINLQQKI
jgi:hypothetical protein